MPSVQAFGRGRQGNQEFKASLGSVRSCLKRTEMVVTLPKAVLGTQPVLSSFFGDKARYLVLSQHWERGGPGNRCGV